MPSPTVSPKVPYDPDSIRFKCVHDDCYRRAPQQGQACAECRVNERPPHATGASLAEMLVAERQDHACRDCDIDGDYTQPTRPPIRFLA